MDDDLESEDFLPPRPDSTPSTRLPPASVSGGGYHVPNTLDNRNNILSMNTYFQSVQEVQDMTIIMISSVIRMYKMAWEQCAHRIKEDGKKNFHLQVQHFATPREEVAKNVQKRYVREAIKAQAKLKRNQGPVNPFALAKSLRDAEKEREAIEKSATYVDMQMHLPDSGAKEKEDNGEGIDDDDASDGDVLFQRLLAIRTKEVTAELLKKEPAVKTFIELPFQVGLIGCGKVGTRIVQDFISGGSMKPVNVKISTRRPEKLSPFSRLGVECFFDNLRLVQTCPLVLVCVLPHQLRSVQASLEDAEEEIKRRSAILSKSTARSTSLSSPRHSDATIGNNAAAAAAGNSDAGVLEGGSSGSRKENDPVSAFDHRKGLVAVDSKPTFSYPSFIVTALGTSISSVTLSKGDQHVVDEINKEEVAKIRRMRGTSGKMSDAQVGSRDDQAGKKREAVNHENVRENNDPSAKEGASQKQEEGGSKQPDWMKIDTKAPLQKVNNDVMKAAVSPWLNYFSPSALCPTVIPPSVLYYSLLSSTVQKDVERAFRSMYAQRNYIPMPHVSREYYKQDLETACLEMLKSIGQKLREIMQMECRRYMQRFAPFTGDHGAHDDIDKIVSSAEKSLLRNVGVIINVSAEKKARAKMFSNLMFPVGSSDTMVSAGVDSMDVSEAQDA